MDRKNAVLAALAGMVLAASATAALAGEQVRREVYWTTRPCGCVVHVRHVRYVRHVTRRIAPVRYVFPLPPPLPPVEQPVEVVDNSVGVSDVFFADAGGVGPGFIEAGDGGGGGGFIAERGGAIAFANARASASASASASISVAVMNRNHMMQMRMMRHGYGGGMGGHRKW